MEKKTALQSIKAKCLDCCLGNPMDVKLCPARDCPLYPFREGHNPNRKGIGNKKPNTNGLKQNNALSSVGSDENIADE